MSPAEFAARVARIEELDRSSPLLYRAYAIGWAMLGYLVLGMAALIALCVLALLTTLAVLKPGVGTVKLALLVGLPAGWLAWNVAKALHVRFSPPDGLSLRREDAPELWADIERICEETGAPALHGIFVTGEVNAAMSQTPRFGVLGLTRNQLILGLPLLRSLSEDEARSVIAHEFGHLAGQHGRLKAWMWRMRLAWSRIQAQSAQGEGGPKLLRWFLAWYGPRLAAATFVLARSHERAADQTAIAVAGADSCARALARTAVLARAAQDGFWKTLDRRALRQEALPAGFLAPLQGVLDAPPEARRWLRESLAVRTSYADTHPSLEDRLRENNAAIAGALRSGNLPPRPGRTAARAWLANCEARLASALDGEWRTAVSERWEARQAEGGRLAAERNRLLAVAQPTTAQLWDLAQIVQQLDGDGAARPHLELVLAGDRQHAGAAFQLGSILLAEDDARGEILLRHAAEIDPEARIPAAALMAAWHERHGRSAEALAWEGKAYDRSQEEASARRERAGLPERKRLRAVVLGQRELALIRATLLRQAEVGEAHVVGVEAKHLPERRWLLVALRIRVPWWKPRSAEADAALAMAVAADLHALGDVTVVVRSGKTVGLAKAAAKLAGEPVNPKATAQG